jgi:DinB superfamily
VPSKTNLPRRALLPCFVFLIAAFAAQAQNAPAPAPAPQAAPAAQAPAPPSTPEADVLRSYNGLKGNILKAADKMPADGYSFRPTPDIRTYARVVNHITEVQLRICGGLNGTAPESLPKVPAETADKADIVAALQASYAECDKAYAALTDANLLEKVSLGPLNRSRISLAWQNVAHDDEQYATLALYLRLKGIVPPSSEK